MSDRPVVFECRTVIARKQHKCCECDSDILKGEQYSRSKGIWDKPDTFAQCLSCASVLSAIMQVCEHDDEYPAFGNLSSDLWDWADNWSFAKFDDWRERMAQELNLDVGKILKLCPKIN